MGLCIEDNQYSLIKTAQSAREFWDNLQKYHEKVTVTSRVSLLKKLCNLNLREGGDLEAHLFDLDDLFDRLENAGQELQNQLKIAMILRSLPDSYSSLVTALESRPDEDLTVELVRSKLLDEFECRKDRSEGSSGGAKALKSGVKSHSELENKSKIVCFFCKKSGHMKKDCLRFQAVKNKSQKDNREEHKKNDRPKAKQATEKTSGAVLFMAGEKRQNIWVVDSGASSHMCNDRSVFTSLNEESAPEVILADGTVVQSAGCGTGVLIGVDGCGNAVDIKLSEVLFVSSLNSSLLSVAKLAAKGFLVIFRNNDCDICDRSGTVKVKGIRSGSLYHLNTVEKVMKTDTK